MQVVSRGARSRLLLLALALVAWGFTMIRMPGESFRGTLPALDDATRRLGAELRADVEHLAGTIGERSTLRPAGLAAAAAYLHEALAAAGCIVRREAYDVRGLSCDNIEGTVTGRARPEEFLVVGAHYDAVPGCPGANDNGSGVAAMLALARRFAAQPAGRTLKFVAFVNEEPPHFQTANMGSLVYARNCKARGDRIVAMLSLETIGYYSDRPGSQRYPPPFNLFYPSRGTFIAFVGNWSNRALVRRAVGSFRRHAAFPSEGAAPPGLVPGVGWSDHWSFWKTGYPSVMVTDTAPFRYPFYHSPADTPAKLDYDSFARVVAGLVPVVADLASGSAWAGGTESAGGRSVRRSTGRRVQHP